MMSYYHTISSKRRWGGNEEDYVDLHSWFDEPKSHFGDIRHRALRHHSEGIFECEIIFGKKFKNSDGKTVYTRYVGEQHVKEDCNNYIPSAKEWIVHMNRKEKPDWMRKTLKIED